MHRNFDQVILWLFNSRHGIQDGRPGYKKADTAGVFTAVYIIARAAGKMGGAALGPQLSHAAPTVKNILAW